MDSLKSFVFVDVVGEDLVEGEIEVEVKPILVTQDHLLQCDSKPTEEQTKKRSRREKLKFTHKKQRLRSSARLAKKNGLSDFIKDGSIESKSESSGNEQVDANETDVVNHNSSHNNIQITNIVSKTESVFNSENNNDSQSNTQSSGEGEGEALDPLENHCDLETKKNVREEPVQAIAENPTSNGKRDVAFVKIDTKILIPYIKKLCLHCQKVTELVQPQINVPANKICNTCKKPVAYCCKLCLEISSLKEMLIHIFKFHYNEATSSIVATSRIVIPSEKFLCGKCRMILPNPMKLKEHQVVCDVLPNLFCPFCTSKMRTKREMRQHMMETHVKEFKLNTLEKMLDEIVIEGDRVMGMLTLHSGYCNTCEKSVPLTLRPIYCPTCTNKLVYLCKDRRCKLHEFTSLSSFHIHLRWHTQTGWTTEIAKRQGRKYDANRKVCHICGLFEGDRPQIKKHMSIKHPEILLCKCDLCGKNLKNVRVWKKHQSRYCPVTHQKLQCEHCWFRSFEKARLRKHLKSVHTHLYTGKRPRCNKCGITWAGLYRLHWHLSRCSGDFKVEKAKQRELWAMRGVVTLS